MSDNDEMERAERINNRRKDRRSSASSSSGSRGRGRSQDAQDSQSSGPSDPSNTTVTDDTSETNDSSGASESTAVREQKHVAMYLEEDLAEDLDLRFDELQLAYRKEHGEKMTKNGDFYPALARAAINDTTVTEELGLESE